MTIELGVLGAGAILPRAGHGCSGYVLRDPAGGPVTLLDCGPGSVRALPTLGVELVDVRRVVLSHFHPDHCLDLFALAFARRNPSLGAPPELELHGPPGLARLLDEAPATFGDWARDPRARIHEVGLDASGRASFEAGGLRFACTRNGHSSSLVALSWRVDTEAGSLLYTGDTNEDERVARLGEGVDLFVSECSFADDDGVPNHLTPTRAARLARAAGATRLLLTHFYPSIEPEEARARAGETFSGPVEIARDGSVHPLARSRRMDA